MTTSTIDELRATLQASSNDAEHLVALLALAERIGANNPREALALANASVALAEKLGDKNRIALGLHRAAAANARLGNFEEAREQFERVRKFYEELGDMRASVIARGCVAVAAASLGEYAHALEEHLAVRALSEELGDRKLVAEWTGNIVTFYLGLGEYAKAMDECRASLALHEELGNRRGIATAMGSIGAIFGSIGEHAKALEQARAVCVLSEELGDRNAVSISMERVGSAYRDLGQYEKALEQYRLALALYEELGDRRRIANVTGEIGGVYYWLDDYAQALKQEHAALSMFEALGDSRGVAKWMGNIGTIYAEETFEGYDPAAGEEYLLRALDIAVQGGFKHYACVIHQVLSDLYGRQTKWERAHHHATQYHALKEQVNSHEAHKQAQLFEHRRQIAEMEKQRALDQAEAKAEHLRAQLLESQLQRKQQELASTAMHLAKQSEMLGRFRNDLRSIMRDSSDAIAIIKQFKEKLKELPCEAIDWSKFEAEFSQTYPDFQSKLLEVYPTLSKMEVKICSLLKLKLTSLDIAQLLCLSERSVEWHRSNVRKKLGVRRGQDVYEALDSV